LGQIAESHSRLQGNGFSFAIGTDDIFQSEAAVESGRTSALFQFAHHAVAFEMGAVIFAILVQDVNQVFDLPLNGLGGGGD
jgi:hypothetical protein